MSHSISQQGMGFSEEGSFASSTSELAECSTSALLQGLCRQRALASPASSWPVSCSWSLPSSVALQVSGGEVMDVPGSDGEVEPSALTPKLFLAQ